MSIKSRVEIVAYLESGRGVWEYAECMSFVAARVYSLVLRAAQGATASLQMPPALAAVWREYENSCGVMTPSQRYTAQHMTIWCTVCDAEHPYLGWYEWSEAERRNVVVTKNCIKTCAVCGGPIGRNAGDRPCLPASVSAGIH
ncbi:MAG: hypothetical protein QOJ70_1143 [Acidobacteriota bacterium]|jgi:hypothetical protein|nr:hypothetical protein [Acidobacteriota bacterium]